MKLALGAVRPSTLLPSSRTTRMPIRCAVPAVPQKLKMGKKWTEYHGSKNWDGLLDPLDDKLRSEILRYGKFVEATYNSFEFETLSQSYATCRYPKHSLLNCSGLPGTGYHVTKYLHATSGIELPTWVDKLPSWVTNQSSWIGYVAVCQDKEEITRLGRRDVVVAYRGTATCLEWLENLRSTLTHIPNAKSDMGSYLAGPMVESGFLSLYTSYNVKCRQSLQQEVREEIGKLLKYYGDEPLSITVTGHSLGAALATLTAYDITKTLNHTPSPISVISFGGPRVGNSSFRCEVEKNGIKILRIVNSTDIITKVPGFVINDDVAEDRGIQVAGPGALSNWLQKRVVENTQWGYADVGHELRLCSKNSPIVNGPNSNVATSHELDTYLHLVNGFKTSTCPLRSIAKRVLKKTYRQEKARRIQ